MTAVGPKADIASAVADVRCGGLLEITHTQQRTEFGGPFRLHRRLTAPQARREIEHHSGGAQCSIIGPISLIRMGIFRMQSIWNAPTTNKQRNALRNSYLTAMPSFGRRIGLLRSTPRERAHYRRLVISSVSEPPRPRTEDCVEGLNRLIFSERFMDCVGGCEVAEGCAVLSLSSPLGSRALAKLSIARHQIMIRNGI
jgi:hypothetical protein